MAPNLCRQRPYPAARAEWLRKMWRDRVPRQDRRVRAAGRVATDQGNDPLARHGAAGGGSRTERRHAPAAPGRDLKGVERPARSAECSFRLDVGAQTRHPETRAQTRRPKLRLLGRTGSTDRGLDASEAVATWSSRTGYV